MNTNTITIDEIEFPVIVYKDLRVVTTELLAQAFGADIKNIQKNFERNKDRFVEGKHFYKIVGEELKQFATVLKSVANFSKVRSLIFWTDRGAARHAKMLETDAAWDVFEKMEDSYFERSQLSSIPLQLPEPTTISKTQIGILFNRVKNISSGSGKIRAELWSRFQGHFNLGSYKDLPAEKYDAAMAYLDAKQDEYSNGVEMLYVSRTDIDALVAESLKAIAGEVQTIHAAHSLRVKLLVVIENEQIKQEVIPFSCCVIDPADPVSVRTFISEYITPTPVMLSALSSGYIKKLLDCQDKAIKN